MPPRNLFSTRPMTENCEPLGPGPRPPGPSPPFQPRPRVGAPAAQGRLLPAPLGERPRLSASPAGRLAPSPGGCSGGGARRGIPGSPCPPPGPAAAPSLRLLGRVAPLPSTCRACGRPLPTSRTSPSRSPTPWSGIPFAAPRRPQPGRIPSTKARAGPRVGVGWTPQPLPQHPKVLPRAAAAGPLTYLLAAARCIGRAAPGGAGRGGERGPRRPRSALRGRRHPRGDVTGPRAAHTLRPAWLPPPALPRRPPPAARPRVHPPRAALPPAGGGAASAARCQANRGRGCRAPVGDHALGATAPPLAPALFSLDRSG